MTTHLDAHMTRASQRVHTVVRVEGVLDHLHVLLEPAIHRVPVERNVPLKITDARRVMARLTDLIGAEVVPRKVLVLPDE